MNLVIHNLKKDLHYLRVLLVLWFALLLTNSLFLRSGLDRLIATGEGIEFLTGAYVLLYVLQHIVLIVILCQLVHVDSLAGTSAFWLTRPISGKGVLFSKFLFIFLVLLLPTLLTEMVVLRINGISVPQLPSALAAEVILQIAIFLVPTMLIAALTANLATLVVAGLASVTAFFLIHYAVLTSAMLFGSGSIRQSVAVFPGQWPRVFSTSPSGALVSAILTIALGSGLITYQYLKRRTTTCAVGAALGTCLIIANLNFWNWDLRALRPELPTRSGLNPEALRFVCQGQPAGMGTILDDTGKRTIFRKFEVQGVPSGFFFVLSGLKATLRLPNGATISSSFNNPLFLGHPFRLAQEFNVLNDRVGDPLPEPRPPPLLSLDRETFVNYRKTPGICTAEATLDVYEMSIETIPLRPGARLQGNSGETMVLSIVPHEGTFLTTLANSKPDGFVVTLRESDVRQWLRWQSGASYVLQNRVRKEAMLGRSYPKDICGAFPALHRLIINHSLLYFTTAGIPDYRGPDIDLEWIQHAELLRVANRFVGHLSRSVTIDNFVIDSP